MNNLPYDIRDLIRKEYIYDLNQRIQQHYAARKIQKFMFLHYLQKLKHSLWMMQMHGGKSQLFNLLKIDLKFTRLYTRFRVLRRFPKYNTWEEISTVIKSHFIENRKFLE